MLPDDSLLELSHLRMHLGYGRAPSWAARLAGPVASSLALADTIERRIAAAAAWLTERAKVCSRKRSEASLSPLKPNSLGKKGEITNQRNGYWSASGEKRLSVCHNEADGGAGLLHKEHRQKWGADGVLP